MSTLKNECCLCKTNVHLEKRMPKRIKRMSKWIKRTSNLKAECQTCKTSEKLNFDKKYAPYESTNIYLPRTYKRDIIPAKRSQIPRPETTCKWPHLRGIADNLKPCKEEVDVALLLGINSACGIKPREIIPGNYDDPYPKRIALGWGLLGMVALDI